MPIRLSGATSGSVELAAPAVAGTTVLELPTDSIKPGMVLVSSQTLTAASTISVNNCFTSAYDNYKIVVAGKGTTGAGIQFRLRVGGVDNSATNYWLQSFFASSTTLTGSRLTAQTSFGVSVARVSTTSFEMTLMSPALAKDTSFISTVQDWDVGIEVRLHAGLHDVATAFDGFTLYPSAGTFTGTLAVYGLRKAL